MARISKTGLLINYMQKHGAFIEKRIASSKLNFDFFAKEGFIYRRDTDITKDRRASTWEIKILFEEFILELD